MQYSDDSMSNNNTTNSASVTEFLKIVVVIAKIWVLTMNNSGDHIYYR